MKNKGKKILTVLGLGICVLTSAIGLTGCSGAELTEDQTSKIMDVIDRSDEFMDETIDLLESSNNKLDRQEISKLYQLAKYRLLLNENNIWDNLTITIKDESYSGVDESMEYAVFKLNNKNYMYTHEVESYSTLYYDTGKILQYSPYTNMVKESTNDSDFAFTVRENLVNGVGFFDITEDDIVDYKILENGNYFITTCQQFKLVSTSDELNNFLCTFEINKDGYLVGETVIYDITRYKSESDPRDLNNINIVKFSMTIQMNNLTQAQMQNYVDELESKVTA